MKNDKDVRLCRAFKKSVKKSALLSRKRLLRLAYKFFCIIMEQGEVLGEYERKEKQGKLAELPCAAGDLLYSPTSRNTISVYQVSFIEVRRYNQWIRWDIYEGFADKGLKGIDASRVGYDVFLTREEAEEKLKEMSGNNG